MLHAWAGEVRRSTSEERVVGAEHFLVGKADDRGSMFAADELRADKMPVG
jgi:hypothetical protein